MLKQTPQFKFPIREVFRHLRKCLDQKMLAFTLLSYPTNVNNCTAATIFLGRMKLSELGILVLSNRIGNANHSFGFKALLKWSYKTGL